MNTNDLKTYKNNINNIVLSNVWKGHASAEMNDSFIELKTTLNMAIDDVDKFDAILDDKEVYVELCNEISRLYSAMSSCQSSHGEYEKTNGCGKCVGYSSDINKKEYDRKQLREEIIAKLREFVGIEAELNEMADLSIVYDDVRILLDLDAIIDVCKSGNLRGTTGDYGLFQMYNETDADGNIIPYSGEKYVNEQIALIVSQCRNKREIAVNVGLLLVKLAADKGYYLTYENPGAQGGVDGWVNQIPGTTQYTYHEKDRNKFDPSIVYDKKYNNITQMQEGMDCCAIVSYLLNVATAEDPSVVNPSGFAWEGVGGLDNYGVQISSSEVKPGDIFIAPSTGNPKGHTGMIAAINEDPDRPGYGTITIIESGGLKSSLSVNVYTYTPGEDGKIIMHSKATTLRNMDSVYSGEQISE